MNVKFMRVVFIVAIAMVGGINVFNAQKSEPLSDIALANVEALADGEGVGTEPGFYDIEEQRTDHYYNDTLYKQSKVVRCHLGGKYACSEGNFYRQVLSDGTWGEWIPA